MRKVPGAGNLSISIFSRFKNFIILQALGSHLPSPSFPQWNGDGGWERALNGAIQSNGPRGNLEAEKPLLRKTNRFSVTLSLCASFFHCQEIVFCEILVAISWIVFDFILYLSEKKAWFGSTAESFSGAKPILKTAYIFTAWDNLWARHCGQKDLFRGKYKRKLLSRVFQLWSFDLLDDTYR